MPIKGRRSLPIKEILISYLAINKILYWMNTLDKVLTDTGNMRVALGAVLERVLGQDLPIILILLFFYLVMKVKEDDSWKETILKQAIGGLMALVGGLLYYFILSLIFEVDFVINLSVILQFSFSYIIVTAVIDIKEYLKERQKEKVED